MTSPYTRRGWVFDALGFAPHRSGWFRPPAWKPASQGCLAGAVSHGGQQSRRRTSLRDRLQSIVLLRRVRLGAVDGAKIEQRRDFAAGVPHAEQHLACVLPADRRGQGGLRVFLGTVDRKAR